MVASKNTLDRIMFINFSPLEEYIKTLSPTTTDLFLLVEYVDSFISNDDQFLTYLHNHFSFSLLTPGRVGYYESPLCYCPFALKGMINSYLRSFTKETIHSSLTKLCIDFISQSSTESKDSTTKIATQIFIQLIGRSNPDLLFLPLENDINLELSVNNKSSICDSLCQQFSVSHTNHLLWILSSQIIVLDHYNHFPNPKGLQYWLKYLYHSSNTILIDYLVLVEKGLTGCVKAKLKCIPGGPILIPKDSLDSPFKRAIKEDQKYISFINSFKIALSTSSSTDYFYFGMPTLEFFTVIMTDLNTDSIDNQSEWCTILTCLLNRQFVLDRWVKLNSSLPLASHLLLKEINNICVPTKHKFFMKQQNVISKKPLARCLESLQIENKPIDDVIKGTDKFITTAYDSIPLKEKRSLLAAFILNFSFYYLFICAFLYIVSCPQQHKHPNELSALLNCPIETIVFPHLNTKPFTMLNFKLDILDTFKKANEPLITRLVQSSVPLQFIKTQKKVFVSLTNDFLIQIQTFWRPKINMFINLRHIKVIIDGVLFGFDACLDVLFYSFGLLSDERSLYWNSMFDLFKKDYDEWQAQKKLREETKLLMNDIPVNEELY